MSYIIIISKSVQKQIDDLPNDVKERIFEKIQNLANEPRPDGVVKLKGSDNEYRIRVGDYRVRDEIDDESQLVQLLQCKHRKDVYKKLFLNLTIIKKYTTL
ncbi:type II toxin-antitoxin system RelE/ParE family toxin [Nostoc sp. UHCC 0302]|uniref:type II toxin-antitoxin system RelE family toxin n=1 Tax=Nostoc sp. UHCC 0302 TaxID=3134896 RepID=UPI00311C930D